MFNAMFPDNPVPLRTKHGRRIEADRQARETRQRVTSAVVEAVARKLFIAKTAHEVTTRLRSQRLTAPVGRQIAPRHRTGPVIQRRAI